MGAQFTYFEKRVSRRDYSIPTLNIVFLVSLKVFGRFGSVCVDASAFARRLAESGHDGKKQKSVASRITPAPLARHSQH